MVTEQDAHPLPRVDDLLDSLSGTCLFSTLDLQSGYWQVSVSLENQDKLVKQPMLLQDNSLRKSENSSGPHMIRVTRPGLLWTLGRLSGYAAQNPGSMGGYWLDHTKYLPGMGSLTPFDPIMVYH